MKKKIGEGILSDVLKKMPISGVAELRIPADMKSVIVRNVESLRESALDIFAHEVSKVLSRLDVQRIADDVFKNYSLNIQAKIELHPKKRSKKGKGR